MWNESEPPGGVRFDETGDATRRTWLANERTFLAWIRTGLTALAVAFGAGRLLPALTGGAQWPYAVVGVGFAILGFGFIGCGFVRQREVDEAIKRGAFARLDERLVVALTALAGVLSLFTIVLVVVET